MIADFDIPKSKNFKDVKNINKVKAKVKGLLMSFLQNGRVNHV